MNLLWAAAAGSAFITFAVHTFVGTPFAVPPLRAASEHVPKPTIWLNYLCWHIVTGTLLILAIGLTAASLSSLNGDVAVICIACFACISIVSIIATAKGGIPTHRFPASYLGAATALLGLAGFWV